jgi:riboflavin biosynthesis pyrimidine reductase
LLDELLLTISPVLVGGTDHLISTPALPALTAKPVHVLTESGSVFSRYLLTSND